MAIPGIPMPTNGADAFAKALDLKGLMQEIHQRNQLAEAKKQHEAEMALRREASGRASQLFPYQLQDLKDKHALAQYKQNMMNDLLGGSQGAQETENNNTQGDQYPDLPKLFSGKGMFNQGVIQPGNINLGNRPKVPNPKTGGVSSVYSMSIGTPEGEVLIPRVSDDGRILSEQEAIDQFHKTGKHLGVYSSPEEATKAAQMIHEQQAKSVGAKPHNLLETLKKDPLKRAAFKYMFKFDPLAADKGSAYTGAAREGLDMVRLKDEFGKDSEQYKTAQAIQKQKEQQHADLSEIRHRQLNGLKPGDTEIKDPKTGQIIGFKKQTDAKQKESAKNTVLFNELYPLVYKGGYMLSGAGATAKLEQAAREYRTNPKARKLIDDFLISEKALGNTTVTEAARFGAGRTNQTFNRFAETLKAEDIHKKLKKWIKEYEIPPEATLKAGLRWTKILNDAEKKANSRIPATYDYYFDPEKQFAAQNKQNESTESAPVSKKDEDLIKHYEPELVKINPKYTAENIKTTAEENGLTIGQVIDKLMVKGQ